MRVAAWLLAAAAVGACALDASAADDEPTSLQLRKVAPDQVRLTWTTPVLPPDDYRVRRCLLASVDDTAGECIAQGITGTTYFDTPPAGNFFYLVSGRYGLREGSLGEADDGVTRIPRTAPACGGQPDVGAMTLDIGLPFPMEICGSDVRIRFAGGEPTFQSADCAGIQATFARVGSGVLPGPRAYLVCGSTGSGAMGPGLIATFVFDIGVCPLDEGDFTVASCEVTDCVTFAVTNVPCTLTVR